MLRAYLDDAVPIAEQHVMTIHLADCVQCRARLDQTRTLVAQVESCIGVPVPAVNPQLALMRLRQAQLAGRQTSQPLPDTPHVYRLSAVWRTCMQHILHVWSGPRRMLATSLAALVIAVGLLAFPPVRAAADRLLQVFRVQRVLLMPISPERIAQLESLDFDAKTLFVAKPELINQPAAPRPVNSAAEASQAVGFQVQELQDFPSTPHAQELVVRGQEVYRFQVNVEGARQLLSLMDVHDVTLPDSLGIEPIVADISAWTEARYQGADYELDLYQGPSPNVTLPDGVDLRQLGKAALRLLGMQPAQAESLSHQIDWTSTFILPIPPTISDVRQVTIGDAQGMLVGAQDGDEQQWLLYWQRGDQFYVLQGRGNLSESDMIAAAISVR
jgi:hypothetical protein